MAGTGLTGFLQNLSGGEMIVILIVALVVLGPDRLPEMAKSAGRMVHKLKTMTEGLQSEVSDVMADPSMQPLKELGELAARPRQKLTEYALEAEAEERAKRESEQADQAQQAAAAAKADQDPATQGAGGLDEGTSDEGTEVDAAQVRAAPAADEHAPDDEPGAPSVTSTQEPG